MHEQFICDELKATIKLVDEFIAHDTNIKKISQAAKLIVQAFRKGGKTISCGNGGSYCDAMHFAQELTGKYRENRASLPALAISDGSHLSCVANDFGYNNVFSRFVEGLGQPGDVLFAISTSGNSENIVRAIKTAKDKKLKTIALTGNEGGKIAGLVDVEIRVPYIGYADRIQEFHIKIIHILIRLIELQMF